MSRAEELKKDLKNLQEGINNVKEAQRLSIEILADTARNTEDPKARQAVTEIQTGLQQILGASKAGDLKSVNAILNNLVAKHGGGKTL